MNLDSLLTPVSDEAPCGPDLNAEMDPQYDEYYFGALGRLPSFFVQPGVVRPDGSRTPDRYFDPAEVVIADEASAIDGLLARSRDIRLLTLRAQWECLVGRLVPMSEAFEGIAALLETFPEDVHPVLSGGAAERREAVNDLNQPVTIVQAMQWAGLTGNTEVTLRKLRVASGALTPLEGEDGLSTSALMDSLGQPSYRKKVDETHAAMLRVLDALKRIERACQGNAAAPFSPAFDDVRKVVGDILAAITSARPDLRGADMASTAQTVPETVETVMPAAGDVAPSVPSGPGLADVSAASTGVVSHLHAKRILEACERYYRAHEPSSATLLLVTQARLLIGRPLIEALETLLPVQAGQATVDFGPQTGFQINIDRLRMLTGSLPESSGDAAAPDPGPDPVVQTAQDAAGAIRSVEDYFRRSERSSPVPVLLQRARSYLDRDFQSLVDELIPRGQNN